MHFRQRIIVSFLPVALMACTAQKPAPAESPVRRPVVIKEQREPAPVKTPAENLAEPLPPVNMEFRGVWVATVANVNWPTAENFDPARQKQEAIRYLDMLKDANFNAVIFQVRPQADALYESKIEPWSYYLTGQQGKAPSPYYDPLKFWIEEAHKRGMELHAWINPYRAHHTAGGPVTETSIARKMSESTYRLKNGMYWMDPADEAVQDHAIRVVQDIVKRYDIDGLHMDDYFYPYREYHGADFPDTRSWTLYQRSNGTLSRADWRRANVNKFVKRLYETIKAEKKYVRFGISPFGIWKAGFPYGITGSSQYDELYADAKLWLNEGWCDYFSPQLYWKDGGAQSFSQLLSWWESENTKKVDIWPGLNTVGIRNVGSKEAEIVKQVSLTRSITPADPGVIHYNIDGLAKNPQMLNRVKEQYAQPVLAPPLKNGDNTPVPAPRYTLSRSNNDYQIVLNQKPASVNRAVIFTKYGNNWSQTLSDTGASRIVIPESKEGKGLTKVAVQYADRQSHLSVPQFQKP